MTGILTQPKTAAHDLNATKEALVLIEARGFSRDKNVLNEFELDIARYRK